MEVWKSIDGFEGLYEVSNRGRVKSMPRWVKANNGGSRYIRERILVPGKGKNGYLHIVLSKDGTHKICTIHKLVASAFVPNFHKYPNINHKDENKLNNSFDNLEWCTQKYNVTYGSGIQRCTLTKFKKVCMLDRYTHKVIRTFDSARDAYKSTGISYKNISLVCYNHRHTAGGFAWKFKE